MSAPKIETFEKNIADEIRQRETSVSDFATVIDDGKKADEQVEVKNDKHLSVLLIVVSILIFCAIAGILAGGYLYATGKFDPFQPSASEVEALQEQEKQKTAASLTTLSPTLDSAIGRFVTKTEKTNKGVVLYLSSYPPVFAYMLKNESLYADELAKAVSIARDTKGVKKETVITQTSTTTDGTATTTIVATSSEVYFAPPFVFTDITLSNQNMRRAVSASSTIVYAFLGTQAVVIASSTEGVLSLRGTVLNRK